MKYKSIRNLTMRENIKIFVSSIFAFLGSLILGLIVGFWLLATGMLDKPATYYSRLTGDTNVSVDALRFHQIIINNKEEQ